ncbi:hypothetical protein COTS27_01048 [Spirochaetota bacterium]|nr:hypothetical protein COTS27_01048 [Spirochaetota bacterium]
MKKICLLSFFLITYVSAQSGLEYVYNRAIDEYNRGNFKASKDFVERLIEKNYPNPYIYFVLGKIYREDETYNHNKAVFNLKKYINYKRTQTEYLKSRTNRMYASVNLAYEYLKIWNPENIERAKETLETFAQDSELRDHADFRFCYATVYNSSGYYLLRAARATEVDAEYYLPAINDFINALDKRPELVGVANNLAIAYIRAVELLPKKSRKRSEYIRLVNDLFNKKMYKKKKIFADTKAYFYEKICPDCKQ